MSGPVHPDPVVEEVNPSGMKSVPLKFFMLAGILPGLPMIGVFLADLPIARLLEFSQLCQMGIQHSPCPSIPDL